MKLFLLISINFACVNQAIAIPELKYQSNFLISNNIAKTQLGKSWISENKIIKKMKKIDFVENYDRFKGHRVIRPNHFEELGGIGGLLNIDQVRLNINRYEDGGNSNFFFAHILYKGNGWSYLTNNAYLIIDGTERVKLDGHGSKRESKVGTCSSSGCINYEAIKLIIPYEIMSKMSQANSVEIRIEGGRKSFDAYFKKDHHAQVRKFIDFYHNSEDTSI